MKEKMPFNFYFFRFLAFVILISLPFVFPKKSVSFDNFANFSRVMIGFGFIWLVQHLWNFYKKDPGEPEYIICEDCETPQESGDLINGRCAKCNGVVAKLEGYYDRTQYNHRTPDKSDRLSLK